MQTRILDLIARSPLAWSFDGTVTIATLTTTGAAAIVLPDPERVERAERLRSASMWNTRLETLYHHVRSVRLYLVTKRGRKWKAELRRRYDVTELELAKAEAETWDRDNRLAERTQGWRKKPPTDGQIRLLFTLGVRIPEGLTRGQAAQLIQQTLVSRAVLEAEHKIERQILEGRYATATS